MHWHKVTKRPDNKKPLYAEPYRGKEQEYILGENNQFSFNDSINLINTLTN